MPKLFAAWRARIEPVAPKKQPTDIFGRVLPYCEPLETAAAKYNVWRIGSEQTNVLARRAAMAACEHLEKLSQETAVTDADLDLFLAFEKGQRPCGS